jgi:3-oxoacyl-[acyl-carrier protein] reductase
MGNMSNLTGKVAIVTGASKGIGTGIARALGAAGASVVVNYATSKDGAERVVGEITGVGGTASAVQGDMSKAADVRRLFAETIGAFGRLDVLVNNAGVFQFEPLEAVTESEFHREFNTNVLGPILTIQEAVKHFGTEGGQRDQHQLGHEREPGAHVGGLLRHQERARLGHARARP